MAANWKSSKQGLASLGKQLVKRIWTTTNSTPSTVAAAAVVRRSVHSKVYEKNIDDQVRPAIVPDHLIQLESDKYWAPHPQTGVFGPATENSSAANCREGGLSFSPAANGTGGSSLLEEKAWFRPTGLEDLEKPHYL